MSEPILKLHSINQIGMVVRDLDKSMEAYWRVFGVGPWRVYTFGPQTADKMTYRGKPANYHIRIGQASIGGISLELIQPLDGDTVHKDFLDEHGEGVQHLNFRLQGLDEAMEKMSSAGFELIQYSNGTGASLDGAHAYFDTAQELGIVFELSQPPSRWRAEQWYPAPPAEA
jgi:methylmalonyl-CoA/ethylmalonyl-CoA epimerase